MIGSYDNLLILSSVPGRIRLHLPCGIEESDSSLKNRLERIHGVQGLQVNSLTGNVLISFDHRSINQDILLVKVKEILERLTNQGSPVSASRSPTNPPHHCVYWPGRVVARGLLGHALVDTVWFGAGFLGSAMGLPLAWLGPLHVLMDIAVWITALSDDLRLPRVLRNEQRAGQCAVPPTNPSTQFELCGKP